MRRIGIGDHNSRREVANVINDFKQVRRFQVETTTKLGQMRAEHQDI